MQYLLSFSLKTTLNEGKKKNWMVSEFFEEWIREMDDKLYK